MIILKPSLPAPTLVHGKIVFQSAKKLGTTAVNDTKKELEGQKEGHRQRSRAVSYLGKYTAKAACKNNQRWGFRHIVESKE